MTTSLRHRWLNRWSSSRRSGPARSLRPSPFRPTVEALEDRLAPATLTWVGDIDANWSTSRLVFVGQPPLPVLDTNWSGNVLPQPGDTLVFDSSAHLFASNNNIANLSLANIIFNGGNHSLGGNTATLTGGITVSAGAPEVNINVTLSSDPHTVSVAAGATVTLNRTFGGSGGLTKSGGGTLKLFGDNSYTGTTTVADGTVLINAISFDGAIQGPLVVGDGSGAVGSAVLRQVLSHNNIANTVDVTVKADGWYDLGNFSETIHGLTVNGGRVTTGTATLTLGGTLAMTGGIIDTEGGGTLRLGGGVTTSAANTPATITGNVDLGGATRTFAVGDGSPFYDLILNGVVSNGSLTKDGDGYLRMLGGSANTYTGTTTVRRGWLILGKSAGVTAVAGPLVLGEGGSAGGVQTDNDQQIADAAAVTFNNPNSVLQMAFGSETVGPLTMTTGGYVSVFSGKVLKLAGAVTGGGLTKEGDGDLILGGGAVGAVTVNGGTLRPGTLSSGNLKLNTAATLSAKLNGAAPGDFDQVKVTGTVSLAGKLDAALGFSSAVGSKFTLIDNDGADAVQGTFAGLPEGSIFTVGGQQFRISYAGGTGNDVELTRFESPPPPPAARGIVASLVRVKVKRKAKLNVLVSFADTGATKRQFLSPFQQPAFRGISVSVKDGNGDGVADTVVLTARKKKKTVTLEFPG